MGAAEKMLHNHHDALHIYIFEVGSMFLKNPAQLVSTRQYLVARSKCKLELESTSINIGLCHWYCQYLLRDARRLVSMETYFHIKLSVIQYPQA